MENFHAVGGNGFQHRNAGGKRGKNSRDKEQNAHKHTCCAHGGKHLGQRNKHQAGACAHALGAREHIHSRNDHGTGQQGHAGIKNFDLVHSLIQVHLRLYIRAVGDHNAHGNAEGEEHLAHGIQQNLQKAADGEPLYVRGQIITQPLQTGAQLTGSILVLEGERVTGDHHHQHQQNGHHIAGNALDAALHPVVHDKGRNAHKEQGKHHRRNRGGDKAGKIAVLRGGRRLAGEIHHRVFGDPAADHGIIGHDQHRHQKGENAQEFPFGAHGFIGSDGTLLCAAANGNIRGEQRKAKGQHQCQIHQQKQTAAVLCGKVGKTPQIAHAHRTSGGSKHKADLSRKTA